MGRPQGMDCMTPALIVFLASNYLFWDYARRFA